MINVSRKTKPLRVFKKTERKRWWKYEIKEEDRRIDAIPTRDIKSQRRQAMVDGWTRGLSDYFIFNKERVYSVMKRYGDLLSPVVVLGATFASGWFAAEGMKFESLLVFVIGFIAFGLISERMRDGRD